MLYICAKFEKPMKRLALFISFLLVLACAHAETIVLRTGARVKGSILFENEEVVVVRTDEGARFQYPRTDVLQVLTDAQMAEIEAKEKAEAERKAKELERQQRLEAEKLPEIKTPKKASILVEVAGGAAIQPAEAVGGGVSADLLVGSHHIGGRHVFVGGGVGYHGVFIGTDKYNFLPIQVAVRMPLTEEKHAPMFGVGVGYGIALSKAYLGGLYAGADFGYRCQVTPKSAIAVVAFAQFQQAMMPVVAEIEGVEYAQTAGRSLVTTGVKLAFYF